MREALFLIVLFTGAQFRGALWIKRNSTDARALTYQTNRGFDMTGFKYNSVQVRTRCDKTVCFGILELPKSNLYLFM